MRIIRNGGKYWRPEVGHTHRVSWRVISHLLNQLCLLYQPKHAMSRPMNCHKIKIQSLYANTLIRMHQLIEMLSCHEGRHYQRNWFWIDFSKIWKTLASHNTTKSTFKGNLATQSGIVIALSHGNVGNRTFKSLLKLLRVTLAINFSLSVWLGVQSPK